jgi:diguanylate cyclase (GGDEF)-like protein/PAS domain S-box-containing protein
VKGLGKGRRTILDGLPTAAVVGLVTLAYFGVAKLGLSFSENSEIVSAVWPPSGVGLAATFMLGYRVLPGIFVAAFVANLTGESSAGVAAGIALGNALGFALGAWLLARTGFNPNLRHVRDVLLLAVLGAAAGPALNATIGNATLLIAGNDEWSEMWSVWRVWWLGDLTGVLICSPPILLLLNAWDRQPVAIGRVAEATFWLALLTAATIFLLNEEVTLVYPVFPLLVLIAIRFRQPGAVIAAPLVTALCIRLTDQGKGPFVGGEAAAELLGAQLFVGLAGLTALMVAAARTEWELSESTLADLAQSREALSEAQELAHIGSWEWEIAENRVEWSDELYRIFGVDKGGPRTTFESYIEGIHPDDREWTLVTITSAVRENRSFQMEHRIVRPDGQVRNLDCHGHFIHDETGRQVKMIGTAQDVTEQRQAEEKLNYLAMHDPLTGLANRSLFLDRLKDALESEGKGRVAVLYCDLDDFKNVNDSLGHETGDQMLAALPPRLEEAVSPGNTIARFGGDEFVVLIERVESKDEALEVARRLGDAFARPIRVRSRTLQVTASIGIVFAEPGGITASEVLRDADAAMYRAKASGRGQVSMFDDRLRTDLIERIGIENDLRQAATNGEFELVYQPVYTIDDRTLVGVEALLRWHHPEKGTLLPDRFIYIAEHVGLIGDLGMWVLERACRDAAEWLSHTGREDLTMSVNLSAIQISDSELVPGIERIMSENGMRPGQLAVEITETALLERGPLPIDTLKRLRRLGVRLVIDDFGTGYSSLSYLKRIPFDILKIDQEFVADLGERPEDAAIVEAILSIARALDFNVVAEGVETKEQYDWLRALGCRFGQGHYFTQAMSLDDLIVLSGDGGEADVTPAPPA